MFLPNFNPNCVCEIKYDRSASSNWADCKSLVKEEGLDILNNIDLWYCFAHNENQLKNLPGCQRHQLESKQRPQILEKIATKTFELSK